jgi:hypothetical protein
MRVKPDHLRHDGGRSPVMPPGSVRIDLCVTSHSSILRTITNVADIVGTAITCCLPSLTIGNSQTGSHAVVVTVVYRLLHLLHTPPARPHITRSQSSWKTLSATSSSLWFGDKYNNSTGERFTTCNRMVCSIDRTCIAASQPL